MNDKYAARIESLPTSTLTQLREVDSLNEKWQSGAQLDFQVLKSLKKSVLVTSTGASTRIEGSTLSDEDVEKLMRGISLEHFTDRDKDEVKGYFELLDNVFNAFETLPFSESTIKFFHKEILKYTQKDSLHRGEYKKSENKVAIVSDTGEPLDILFDTTDAWKTPKEMQELVEWTQVAFLEKKFHPLLIIGNFVVEFLSIHPFTDGNGRLSRILTNLLLLQHRHHYVMYTSHEKMVEKNKTEYYLALRNSQTTFRSGNENLAPWMNFFLDVLSTQAKDAVSLISVEAVAMFLSAQQQKIWEYIETTPGEFTPMQITNDLGIPRSSVSQALTKLLKMKWITRKGLGRGTRYERTDNSLR